MRMTALLAAMLAALGGCASIVNGQNQSISVSTPDCPGAACELNNDKGKWFLASTPGSVMINRSYGDLFVRCTKGSNEPATQSVTSKTKGMAFGNILFGGIIGAGIDIANGSAYDYPVEITLPIRCTTTPAEPMGQFRLGCTVREINTAEAAAAGLPAERKGLLVTMLEPGGASALAGLRQGDILLDFDDVPIVSLAALREIVAKQPTNPSFRLGYQRDGSRLTAEFLPKGDRL